MPPCSCRAGTKDAQHASHERSSLALFRDPTERPPHQPYFGTEIRPIITVTIPVELPGFGTDHHADRLCPGLHRRRPQTPQPLASWRASLSGFHNPRRHRRLTFAQFMADYKKRLAMKTSPYFQEFLTWVESHEDEVIRFIPRRFSGTLTTFTNQTGTSVDGKDHASRRGNAASER